jgi:DNA-binding IclR family transcriptional regulator
MRGSPSEPERSQLVALILGTFRETHGERLSLTEAQRLFGLGEAVCRVVLEDLVGQNWLRRTNDGRYTME